MIKVVLGDWFRLPRLGREVFVKLMRGAKLKYDSKKGFMVESSTDLISLISILKSELGEDIEVVLTCFVCGKPVECESCAYRKVCERRTVSRKCICNKCRSGQDAYTIYAATLVSHIKN